MVAIWLIDVFIVLHLEPKLVKNQPRCDTPPPRGWGRGFQMAVKQHVMPKEWSYSYRGAMSIHLLVILVLVYYRL